MAGLLRLQIRDADGQREQGFDAAVVTAGREADTALRLNDPLVSRLHGRFEQRPDGWYFTDAGSRNGSAYNGERLAPEQPRLLRSGDVIKAGNATITVVEAAAIGGPVAPPPGPPAYAAVPPMRPPAAPTVVPPQPGYPPPFDPRTTQADGGRPPYVGAPDAIVHIGRAIDNDIVLNDGFVSSYHVEARPQHGGLLVRDLGSRNGTFVNGQRITEMVVPAGGIIQLGPNATVTVQQVLAKVQGGPEPSLYMRRPADLEHLIAGQGLGRIVGKEQKVILRDIDVSVKRGQFIAIVGGSGAGKSTLMKVLNGYTPPERGTLLIARDAYGKEEEVGYVPQEDIIHRELLLKDALVLSAMLRYPPGTPREVVERRADEVLTELGLSEHTNTLVARLSGGQRKRASVALELMRRPRLLILDEPTSGLDPASGRRVIRLLRSLANTGVGILLVTHAMENVPDCDTIAFLAPGGNLVFWGTLDEATTHFGTTDLAEVYDFLDPDGQNAEGKRAAVQHWRQRFVESTYFQRLQSEIDAGMRGLAPMQQWAPPPAVPGQDSQLLKWQLKGLTARYARTMLGDRRNLALLLGQVPIIVALARILFARGVLQPETQAEFVSFAGKSLNLIFILGASLVWFGTINAAREICKELAIWERESHVGIRPIPYVLSKVTVLGALSAVQTAILVLLVFMLWKVPGGGGAFFGMLIAGFLAAFSGVAVGLAISAAVPTADRAMALVPLAMIPQIMFGGVIIPLAEMGGGKWISVIISSRWAFEAIGRLTERDAYIPRTSKLYEQVDGPWVTPVLALVALGVGFTVVATWLVARTAPKTSGAAIPGPGPGYVQGPGPGPGYQSGYPMRRP